MSWKMYPSRAGSIIKQLSVSCCSLKNILLFKLNTAQEKVFLWVRWICFLPHPEALRFVFFVSWKSHFYLCQQRVIRSFASQPKHRLLQPSEFEPLPPSLGGVMRYLMLLPSISFLAASDHCFQESPWVWLRCLTSIWTSPFPWENPSQTQLCCRKHLQVSGRAPFSSWWILDRKPHLLEEHQRNYQEKVKFCYVPYFLW